MDEHWRQVFSIVVPFISTFGGPYVNTWIAHASPVVRYGLSVLVGMLVSGLGSEFTAYPMHLDAAIAAGSTMALSGQKLLGMQEGQTHAR